MKNHTIINIVAWVVVGLAASILLKSASYSDESVGLTYFYIAAALFFGAVVVFVIAFTIKKRGKTRRLD